MTVWLTRFTIATIASAGALLWAGCGDAAGDSPCDAPGAPSCIFDPGASGSSAEPASVPDAGAASAGGGVLGPSTPGGGAPGGGAPDAGSASSAGGSAAGPNVGGGNVGGGPGTATDAGATPLPDAGPALTGNPLPANDPGSRGSFKVTTENNVGPDQAFTLVRPTELGKGGVLHPVITWGNGTGTMPNTYSFLLTHLASHGFVIIASNNTNVGSGKEMLMGVDWVLSENQNASSPLYQKIDAAHIGATGHSQGGMGTLAAAKDPRIVACAPIEGAFGFSGGFGGAGSGLHGPVLALAGGMDTTVKADGVTAYYDGVNDVPAALGVLLAASHTSWIMDGFTAGFGGFTGGGGGAAMQGGFVKAVTAWMRLFLMQDESMRPLFSGSGCAYCTDPLWTYKAKML